MESELSKLHSQLQRLHTSLSLLPKCTPVLPTLKEVDPVYKLLDHLNIEVSGTLNLLSTVSQELMTLSLAIPGVNRERGRGGDGKRESFRVMLWLYYFITDECGGLCLWDMF